MQLENVPAARAKGPGCPGAAAVGTARLPGKAGHGGAINAAEVAEKKNTLGKKSFSLPRQLPRAEEASRAEVKSQRKVKSAIKELGKENIEIEGGKKNKERNDARNLPGCERGRKSQL